MSSGYSPVLARSKASPNTGAMPSGASKNPWKTTSFLLHPPPTPFQPYPLYPRLKTHNPFPPRPQLSVLPTPSPHPNTPPLFRPRTRLSILLNPEFHHWLGGRIRSHRLGRGYLLKQLLPPFVRSDR